MTPLAREEAVALRYAVHVRVFAAEKALNDTTGG